MKHFSSSLGELLEDYIAYRCSLGFSDKNLRPGLHVFDYYVYAHQADMNLVAPRFFLEFKKTLKNKPARFNNVLLAMRGFCAYLVRRQVLARNPLIDIVPYRRNAFIPYIFSTQQTDQLIKAAGQCLRKQQRYFALDHGAYLAIVLLARCGLRISEPLRLKSHNYNPVDQTIFIEKTKFSKNRLIPLPRITFVEISNYLALRDAIAKDENPYFLSSHNGRSIGQNRLYEMFHNAVRTIGLEQPKRTLANITFGHPTPHSLRHSFAINTLKSIKRRGRSPQKALPVLSAYLGHTHYRYTAVYLKVLDAEHRRGLVDFAISKQAEL